MTTRPHMRPRVRHLVLPLVLALAAALLAAPALASSHKNFSLRITLADSPPDVVHPVEVGGGVKISLVATLTNLAPQQQLGSADIALPDGFTLEGKPTLRGAGTAKKNGNVIELRNLRTQPDNTAVADFVATTSCAPRTHDFTAVAKQANNFLGDGNDFNLIDDPRFEGPERSVEITSGCAVGLRFHKHPAHAVKDTIITSVPFSTTGPVQVEAIDKDGSRDTGFEGDVTVALHPASPGGRLSPHSQVTVEANAGLASFANLRIDLEGIDYRLVATSTDIPAADPNEPVFAVSNAFGIFSRPCTTDGGICSFEVFNPSLTVAASGTPNAAGGLLVKVEEHGALPEHCAGDHHKLSATTTLSGINLGAKTATFTVPKHLVQGAPNDGAAHYQVCAQPLDPLDKGSHFNDRRDGVLVTGEDTQETRSAGLLPDCRDNPRRLAVGAPCVESRSKTGSGDVVIVLRWGSSFRFR